MAAPNPPHPLTPFDTPGGLFYRHHDVPPQSETMASNAATDNQPTGQNHDRADDAGFVPPPPPPVIPQDPQNVNPSVAPPMDPSSQQNNAGAEPPAPGSEGGSGSEGSDSEAEDEPPANQWQPLEEDESLPCEDELAYIESKKEDSATDHKVWEEETFFDLDDPDLIPGENGRIDWLVEHFNGTAENPNNEHVMRSHIVRVGGYDWCIKFYPKGNDTEYLSVYLECVTMQAPEFEETEDFKNPPLPFLSGMDKLKKRRGVPVQFSVIMYNPDEPRVYEYRSEAHQFTKPYNDYGWTRFTRLKRDEFIYRNDGKRQAILRNDKLAFSAYIRVIQDPTGTLWAHHGGYRYAESLAFAGLRPFSPMLPNISAEIPLLHFGPFRDFITSYKDTRIVFWMQTLLWKMMSRKHSNFYGQPDDCVPSDTIAWMKFLARILMKETDGPAVMELIGNFNPDNGAVVGANRLKTTKIPSIQAAVDAHPTAINKPKLLTLELERQEFDRKKRRWQKLTNKVEIQDNIKISGTGYTLFAFHSHCGDLESNKFMTYIRHSESSLWYCYDKGQVVCVTNHFAHSGRDESSSPIKPLRWHADSLRRDSPLKEDSSEVAYAVMYIRDDCLPSATSSAVVSWDVPNNVKLGIPPKYDGVEDDEPPATAVYERFSEAGVAEEVQPASDDRRSSVDTNAGFATPKSWLMDGEDVIMSDADDDFNDTTDEKSRYEVTIEHLGLEYYKGQIGACARLYDGQGHLITMNGNEYIGQFRDGKKDGKGKMIYALTGNIYEGDWLEGERHGQGKLTEAATGNIFEGGWKHGKKHGEFVLRGTVTEEDKGCCSICYDKDISTAFYDCGHCVTCKDCAKLLENCPVCRKRVVTRLELFGVKMTIE